MNRLVKILNSIKSWHWYDWLKYIQATIIFIIAFIFLGTAATIGLVEIIFATVTYFAMLISAGYLIIKDSKFAHCFVLLFCGYMLAYAVYFIGAFRDFPNVADICLMGFFAVSAICLIHLLLNKQIKLVKNAAASMAFGILVCWTLIIGTGTIFLGTEPDIEQLIHKDCIETKIAKGYPKEFAREYCAGPAHGCVEKFYEENCEPDIKCCFATIEEDKKWNYLEYDEHGNKIIINP